MESDSETVNLDGFEGVADAEGHHLVFDELAIAEAEEHVAFANTGIAYDDDFLNVIVVFGFAFLLRHSLLYH